MSVAQAPQSPAAAPPSPPAAPGRHPGRRLRLGVLGAVLAFVAMASLQALVVRPFLPADESGNVAYSLSVSRGELPRIDAPIRGDLPGQLRMPLTYVAVHPPLYYALVSPGLRFGVESGHARLGITLARLETVLLSVGAVLLTAVLATVLTRRRRPELAVGAAALLATTASYALVGGIVHNDGLATTLVTAQLLATVLVLLRGLRPGLVLVVLATAALAMLTRVSSVSAVALSAAALVAAGLLHSRSGWLRGALRGAGWAVALGLTCAATSGWFYLRNKREYGDFTGGDEVERLLGLHTRPGSVLYHALKPDTLNQLLTRMFGLDPKAAGIRTGLLWAVLAAVGVGLAVLAVRTLRSAARRRSASAADGTDPATVTSRRAALIAAAIGALLVLHVAGVLLQIGSHIRDGGGTQPRYLFPTLPVLLIGAAAALLALPGRIGRAALVLAIAVQAALSFASLAMGAVRSTDVPGRLDALLRAVDLSGAPLPTAVFGVLVLGCAAGLVLVAGAIWTAPRSGPAGAGPSAAGD